MGDATKKLHYSINEHKGANSIAPNPDVENLYSSYIKNNINTSSPEFRKEILVVAMKAFGTPNFLQWFSAQFRSPAAGDTHKRFLEDTLKFISSGNREMSLETWSALLHITDEGDKIGVMGDESLAFFGMKRGDSVNTARVNVFMTDIIQQWCSKPGGLEDLLGSLHILFGNV
jgi:hypothetical protein